MPASPVQSGATMTADGTFSIGTAAAVISAAGAARRIFKVQNTHASQILYLGPSSAVSSTAYAWKLVAGASVDLDGYNGALYGYGSGASTTGAFIEVRE